MIIKLFKHKGPSASAVNYCMSAYDHTKKKREVAPRVLRGDPEYTKSLDEMTSQYTVQATSGVISFRDNENLTEEQKQKLLDDFEDTFIGTKLKDKVNCLYIEHYEKGNLEIHFIINNVVIDSKPKYFNPFPPGHIALSKAFTQKKNFELAFDQVNQKSILNNGLSGEENKALQQEKKTGKKHGFHNLHSKRDIVREINRAVKSKEVNNREELISFLKEELGLSLSRIGNNYISIQSTDPKKKNIRLKGGIFSANDNQSYVELQRSLNKKNEQPFNIEEVNKQYLNEMAKRVVFNTKRYSTNDDPRGYDKTLNLEEAKLAVPQVMEGQATKKNSKKNSGVIRDTSSPIRTHEPQTVIQPVSEHIDSRPMSTPSPLPENRTQADFEPLTPDQQVIDTNGIFEISTSAAEQLANALSQLANARTPEQRARAEVAVAKAKIAKSREDAQNEMKKQQLLASVEIQKRNNLNRRKI